MVFRLSGLSGKDSIFMGNIDKNRLSALLERIGKIKVELEALENEARALGTGIESRPPVSEPAEATVATEASSDPTEDTPIEIDIQGIDIPPIIEDPAAEYHAVSTHNQAQSTSGSATDDIPATKPTSTVIEPDTHVIDPGEVTAPLVQQDAPTIKSLGHTEAATSIEKLVNQPDDDLPFDEDLPIDEASAISEQTAEPVQEPAPKTKDAILDSRKAETAVMDVMAEKQAWRTDRPGSQVKNVISAISLNDRVLLINVLFREDPILFQNTISAFNSMTTLDEALTYIQTNFPDWDLNSEPVYRLMMAVRRKLK